MEIALNLSLLVLLFGNLVVDLLALGAKFLDACETREKDWDCLLYTSDAADE